jgi:adenylate kinase family enzyme
VNPGGAPFRYGLPDLGQRIVICGPSCVGKSTLAIVIGSKLGLPVVHLDQLRHLPHTDWQTRSDEDFRRQHDEAIQGQSWVIEGNYSALMPQRLARATGAILLDANRWQRLARYFRRTLWQSDRPGHLEGALDSVKWMMIHWILVMSPKSAQRNRQMLRRTALPLVEVTSARDIETLYRAWYLKR